MSLILDALRKSERTRQQTLTGQLSAVDATPGRAHIPIPWATLIGILLVANAAILSVIFWRTHSGRPPAATAGARLPREALSTTLPAPVYRPEIRSLAAEAADTNSTGAAAAADGTATAAPPENTLVAVSAGAAKTAQSTSEPAPSAAAGSPPDTVSIEDAPALDTLPLAFQQSLPPLHLDVHGYTQKPADRFVVINMQRYQTGDTLKEGPKIIAITPQGVVLDYNGRRFLLPRP
jgi:general secretion pathway protein B